MGERNTDRRGMPGLLSTLMLAVAGITGGAAAAVGHWLGRNEALVEVAAGVAHLLVIVIRRPIPKKRSTERKEPTI